MFKTDTGNFNRFLTSIGLLLLAAAVLIPYFFFRDTETLRMSQMELRALTETARGALEARQRRSADLELPILIFSGLLGVGGVVALGLGGKRLRIAQEKEDEAIDRRARREDYEIQRLTGEEVEERRNEQAREVVTEPGPDGAPADAQAARAAVTTSPEPPAQGPPRERTATGSRQSFAAHREEIERVEKRAQQILGSCELNRFKYLADVKIVGPPGSPQVSVDGLFESQWPSQPDVAMELKVPRASLFQLRNRTRIYSDVMLAGLSRYKAVTGKDVLGWLLIVVLEAPEEVGLGEREQIEARFNNFLAGLGKCSIVSEHELEGLPQRFIGTFGK